MATCEMCGKESPLMHALVEGIEMDLCQGCSSYGQKLEPKSDIMIKRPRSRPAVSREEDAKIIVSDFGSLIRKKREQLGLTQEQLGKKLAERESIITKIESGSFKPSIPNAEKIEKILGITLIEQAQEVKFQKNQKSDEEPVTIGDMIKIRKR